MLLTLPCKELENQFCNGELLHEAMQGKVTVEVIQAIIDEESRDQPLVEAWGYQAKPQIRNRCGPKDAEATKEQQADQEFQRWSGDPKLRARLVSGKRLLGRIRQRIKQEHKVSIPSSDMFRRLAKIKGHWKSVADAIFPEALDSEVTSQRDAEEKGT